MPEQRQPASRPIGSADPADARVALIAGAGELPLEAARLLEASGREVVGVGFESITAPMLERAAHAFVSLELGQLGSLLRSLDEYGCRELLLIGKFEKSILSQPGSPVRPDELALELLASSMDRSDDGLMASIAGWLESREFVLLDQREALAPLLADEGAMTAAVPCARAMADIEVGLSILDQPGREGDAQCVVVKDGRLVAQETALGTDAAIRRAGQTGGVGMTVLKGARMGQDLRFDLPTVGPGTIATMEAVSAETLAIEAGRCLIVDRDRCLADADRAGIVIWGFGSHRNVR